MGKGKIGGKYAEETSGVGHEYKLVGKDSNGKEVVGYQVFARSKQGAIKAAKNMGFTDIINNSVMRAEKFESVLSVARPPLTANSGNDAWKRAKQQEESRRKKK